LESISRTEARRFAIHCQLLDRAPMLGSGTESVYQAISHLGYVQIDTISVVERAHHHTLWSRCPDYKPHALDVLLSQERRIFEYWGHLASYLPLSDYRFYLPYMARFPWKSAWTGNLWEKNKQVAKEVLARIVVDGPLSSKDFTHPEGGKRGTWWDWKPAKIALELLVWKGDLMVTARKGFQKIYDLSERVLPPDTDTRLPSEEEQGEFFVRRALTAHGLATRREMQLYLSVAPRASVESALGRMVEMGEAIQLQVEGDEKSEYYALGEVLEAWVKKPRKKVLQILSPFDSFITNRERLLRLFGFDYQLECFMPASKRKIGYFSLPILWGEKLVGRMDSKAERRQKLLVVKNLVLEKGFKPDERFTTALGEELHRYARFNGCESLRVEKCEPASIVEKLNDMVHE
jgi:uncharacterized protein